ncbi:MAG: hypothetical protein Q8J87_12575, partial [Sediminibacterium sp.]|nr:hypothetical protein [Sediminibacterium sp.]
MSLLLVVLGTNAQSTQRVKFNVFKSSDGLSKQVIKGISEDENGFIWLLSDHQLQWFDGSNFHTVPFGNKWAVKKEGVKEPLSTHNTKD